MLPGSLRGSQEDGNDEERQQQQQPVQQRQPQRRTSKSQGSFNMHTLHGVKSGAWGMLSQNLDMPLDEQQ
jgi:hypothetical protein